MTLKTLRAKLYTVQGVQELVSLGVVIFSWLNDTSTIIALMFNSCFNFFQRDFVIFSQRVIHSEIFNIRLNCHFSVKTF